jgi:hypothetical protein
MGIRRAGRSGADHSGEEGPDRLPKLDDPEPEVLVRHEFSGRNSWKVTGQQIPLLVDPPRRSLDRGQVIGDAAVLTGHAHTAAASTFAARPLIVAPAITWTLRMPWEGDQPADRDQPPGLAFHIVSDDRRLPTHYRDVL